VSGASIWLAIAQLTGLLNLFNLTPIWQLDGSRGFDALSVEQRWLVLGVIGATISVTGLGVLWLVGAVALYRTIATGPGPGHAQTLASFVVLVPLLAWFARSIG
jgi:Zn-dependent protease